ncbi:deoxyribose-phosphate aldolase [uncultured Methylobacterium sp.]|jgi:deoxyribose-phosphate aldolase|uniref:deoxyribose-phosphate aldolase n=1 Tax=uncultured Methylobacterium sp. TaxID=157278 RepID=UPI00262437A1|nr:deoxyribose-phosphate aldolase [uncultured Methylobacterium sp.]
MTSASLAAAARRALPLLDLTDLSGTCTPASIDALCAAARDPRGPVAAVCVWPRFVAQAADALRGSPVRVATVVNFPEGGEDAAAAEAETRAARSDGADEIDLVLPYRAVLRGDPDTARAVVTRVRAATGDGLLKLILETGELADPGIIAAASRLGLDAGADFLKTSTGKSPVSATPEAADIMLAALREAPPGRGLKVSGGLRRVEDAALYLALADRAMGPGWATPATVRLGASSLHAALLAALDTGDPA